MLVLLVLALSSYLTQADVNVCILDDPVEYTHQPQLNDTMFRAAPISKAGWKPLKIQVQMANGMSPALRTLTRQAANYFEKSVKVRRSTTTSTLCTGVGRQVTMGNGDFVVVVQIEFDGGGTKCSLNKGLQARAATCATDQATERPLVGLITVCQRTLQAARQPHRRPDVLATMKHELLHALGFSTSFFNKNKKSMQMQRWVYGGRLIPDTVEVIATPRATEEVRKHFGCDKLQGIPLENQGGRGTEGSHFEKRIFGNEAMTGTQTSDSVFSSLTFAVLQDTGWYEVDYSQAEELKFGKGLGCDFVFKGCGFWIDSQSKGGDDNAVEAYKRIQPYCDPRKILKICSSDRRSIHQCNAKQDGAVKKEYQYFQDPKHAGQVELADFCPFFQEYTASGDRSSVCGFGGNQPQLFDEQQDAASNMALELFGKDSKCIDITSEKIERMKGESGHQIEGKYGGCYKVVCEDGRFSIHSLGSEKGDSDSSRNLGTCYAANQPINVNEDVEGYTYKLCLKCPACSEVCSECAADDEDKAADFECTGLGLECSQFVITMLLVVVYWMI